MNRNKMYVYISPWQQTFSNTAQKSLMLSAFFFFYKILYAGNSDIYPLWHLYQLEMCDFLWRQKWVSSDQTSIKI